MAQLDFEIVALLCLEWRLWHNRALRVHGTRWLPPLLSHQCFLSSAVWSSSSLRHIWSLKAGCEVRQEESCSPIFTGGCLEGKGSFVYTWYCNSVSPGQTGPWDLTHLRPWVMLSLDSLSLLWKWQRLYDTLISNPSTQGQAGEFMSAVFHCLTPWQSPVLLLLSPTSCCHERTLSNKRRICLSTCFFLNGYHHCAAKYILYCMLSLVQ